MPKEVTRSRSSRTRRTPYGRPAKPAVQEEKQGLWPRIKRLIWGSGAGEGNSADDVKNDESDFDDGEESNVVTHLNSLAQVSATDGSDDPASSSFRSDPRQHAPRPMYFHDRHSFLGPRPSFSVDWPSAVYNRSLQIGDYPSFNNRPNMSRTFGNPLETYAADAVYAEEAMLQEAMAERSMSEQARVDAETAEAAMTELMTAKSKPGDSMGGFDPHVDPNEALEQFFAEKGDSELTNLEIAGALSLIGQAVWRDESLLDFSNISESADITGRSLQYTSNASQVSNASRASNASHASNVSHTGSVNRSTSRDESSWMRLMPPPSPRELLHGTPPPISNRHGRSSLGSVNPWAAQHSATARIARPSLQGVYNFSGQTPRQPNQMLGNRSRLSAQPKPEAMRRRLGLEPQAHSNTLDLASTDGAGGHAEMGFEAELEPLPGRQFPPNAELTPAASMLLNALNAPAAESTNASIRQNESQRESRRERYLRESELVADARSPKNEALAEAEPAATQANESKPTNAIFGSMSSENKRHIIAEAASDPALETPLKTPTSASAPKTATQTISDIPAAPLKQGTESSFIIPTPNAVASRAPAPKLSFTGFGTASQPAAAASASAEYDETSAPASRIGDGNAANGEYSVERHESSQQAIAFEFEIPAPADFRDLTPAEERIVLEAQNEFTF